MDVKEGIEQGGMEYGMEELIPIVAKLSRKMTGGESTSITYEKAQHLMEAVQYCIREWELGQGCALSGGKRIPAEQAYGLGYGCVVEKVKKALALYNEILESFDAYGNACLYSTVVKEMPGFFKWYDVRFAPQNTILTLDYPVTKDLSKFSGIDVIWEYLNCIREEQDFLGRLDRDYVVGRLRRYCDDYEDMVENLWQIVSRGMESEYDKSDRE